MSTELGPDLAASISAHRLAHSRYIVLGELGRGAMGRVLRAYDPKLQREVALKEVHADRLGDQLTLRLINEARAMAKLSHPNVVGVYDVEAASADAAGPPRDVVLVMEYVEGQTLRQWLGHQPRPWADVVRRFIDAGRGLAGAHSAGLLHRDFKPSNVMCRSDGAVKVMDFGLAKPSDTPTQVTDSHRVDGDRSEDRVTQMGMVMGTPAYMAPEQHRGLALTPAADQYAFCVALWEALAGALPFTQEQALAVAKTNGPPIWPGHDVPRFVVDAVRRGMSADPRARWGDMQQLLQGLAHDPRERRRRWATIGVTSLGVLAAGAAGLWAAGGRDETCVGARAELSGIWDDGRRQRVRAAMLGSWAPSSETAWQRSAAALDVYADGWVAMHEQTCRATTVLGEQSAEVMDRRMACLRRARTGLDSVVTVLADADRGVVTRAHRLTAGLAPLQRCADVRALLADVEPPLADEVEAVAELRAGLSRVRTLFMAGRFERATSDLQQLRGRLTGVEYPPAHVEFSLAEARAFASTGDHERAQQRLRAVLREAATHRQRGSMWDAAALLLYLVGYEMGRADEGRAYWPIAKGLSHGNPSREAAARNGLASALVTQGKFEQAELEYRRALVLRQQVLDPQHPLIAQSHNNVAVVLLAAGRYQEALEANRRGLDLWLNTVGPDHPDVATSRNNIAGVLTKLERYDEAAFELEQALEIRMKLGSDHPSVARSQHNMAALLQDMGRNDEAESRQRQALEAFERTIGPDRPEVAAARSNLARLLARRGELEAAEREVRQAVTIWETSVGVDHPDTLGAQLTLVRILCARGPCQDARSSGRRALATLEATLGPRHVDVVAARDAFAMPFTDEG